MAPLMRMTRASMLGVLSSDFIRTARASGLSRAKVLYAYAFRNALLPVVTTLGMVFSFLLGSNVLVEKVFAWPGIGSYVIEALVASDYAPVQGFVLTMALLYVAAQSLHRHSLWRDRSAGERGGMSVTTAAAVPGSALKTAPGLRETWRHVALRGDREPGDAGSVHCCSSPSWRSRSSVPG